MSTIRRMLKSKIEAQSTRSELSERVLFDNHGIYELIFRTICDKMTKIQ